MGEEFGTKRMNDSLTLFDLFWLKCKIIHIYKYIYITHIWYVCVCIYLYIYKYVRDLQDILDYGKTNLHNGPGSWGHFLQGNRRNWEPSLIPSKQMDSVLGIRRVLSSSIRRSPNYSHKGIGWLSQRNATGRKQLQRLELPQAEWKATLERVWMSQWLWTSAFIQRFLLPQAGGGWGLEAQPTPWHFWSQYKSILISGNSTVYLRAYHSHEGTSSHALW